MKKFLSSIRDMFKPTPRIAALVRVEKGPSRKWYSTIVANNGETVYTSEVYSSKTKCVQTAILAAKQLGVPLETV